MSKKDIEHYLIHDKHDGIIKICSSIDSAMRYVNDELIVFAKDIDRIECFDFNGDFVKNIDIIN